MKDNAVMPVTIITGFLGAGKTTFLNEILRRNKDANFLIIENEAGNINIDRELLRGKAKNNVFELTGGCICCSLSTELGTALNSVILSQAKYDYVLIEATGMADAGSIINLFSGARVQRYFKLDAVVGLVDATSFLERLPSFDEVRKQVAQSNLLLLNKCDLILPERVEEVEQQLSSINPFAKIEKVTYANIKNIPILNTDSFNPSKAENSIANFSELTLAKEVNEHVHSIQSLSYRLPGHFDMKKVSLWFEQFLHTHEKFILRIKAILSIEGMKHKMILQSVGDDFHITQGSQWLDNEDRESKIVLIGTEMQEDQIRKNLQALLSKA